MEPYNPETKKCPQGCGGALKDTYHAEAETKPGFMPKWSCSDYELPHMHRACSNCHYEWAETPLA